MRVAIPDSTSDAALKCSAPLFWFAWGEPEALWDALDWEPVPRAEAEVVGLSQSQPTRTRKKRTYKTHLAVLVCGAVVFAGGSLTLRSPTCAGATGELRSSAFWYTPRPSTRASDTTFQPFETMRGYALIKLETAKSDNSCSSITRPGVLGPGYSPHSAMHTVKQTTVTNQ